MIFIEAQWVIPKDEIVDAKALHLCAFHFHRKGHEDHSEYQGRFPEDVFFGDTVADVISKLGPPVASGGGGMSTVLKKPIPRWLRYSIGDAIFQLQLDENGKVEMVTLYVQDQKPGSGVLTE